MKKIVRAVWKQATCKWLPGFFFNILILIYFFKYKTIEIHARTFLPLNISVVGKDLYQVQETWKLFFLTHIQLCVR